ncbi:helix-turn-helix transcriptional regulator [Paenibacillus sp. GCM10027628]|uniref:helix-turn-helix transcriptional regulator n=1 Tax=Paenibacillus sp. GCM10027628 TaxID=3273413 RepID=UPI00363845D7
MRQRTDETSKDTTVRTRRAIVNLLKEHGSLDAAALAERLDISRMAVRQHLYALQEEKLVDYEEEARAMGRPAKMWRLTPEANRLFQDGYAELTVSLIDSMKEAFGEAGLEKLLEVRNKKQIEQYRSHVPAEFPLQEKLQTMAELRTKEGYMAEIQAHEDGSYSFIEKHCPICEAAMSCSGLCQNELNMLRTVLGEQAEVERVEHILSGENRCVYTITQKQKLPPK